MSSFPGTFVAIQSVKVPPRSIAISIPAFGGTGGGVMAEGIVMTMDLNPQSMCEKGVQKDYVEKNTVLKVDEV